MRCGSSDDLEVAAAQRLAQLDRPVVVQGDLGVGIAGHEAAQRVVEDVERHAARDAELEPRGPQGEEAATLARAPVWACSITSRRCGSIIRPSSVRWVWLRSRLNSGPPSSSSSSLIARVSEGWVTLHFSAARVKLSVSHSATK